METLSYFIVIFIFLCLLSIFIIVIEYFSSILLDWLLKKEYRLFSFLFLSLISVSSYSTYLLIKPSIDILYCYFYVLVITFSTVACFFIFFKIRKTAHPQGRLTTNSIGSSETILLNKEALVTYNDKLIGKLNDENISKDPKKTKIINYNSSFTINQLNYLWTKFRGYGIIDDNYSKDDFCKNFLSNPIMLTLNAISLYYLRKEVMKIVGERIKISDFIIYFRDQNNNKFISGSVKNGSRTPNHKLLIEFENIFTNFPI